jgi:hypothetical protein
VGVLLVVSSAWLGGAGIASAGEPAGIGPVQLRGNHGPRPAGRDLLFEILNADDGVMVKLTSPSGETTTGLACLSPSKGLWLAVDLAEAHADATFQAWLAGPDGLPRPLATIDIDRHGSGRVVVGWEDRGPQMVSRSMAMTLTNTRGIWPFSARHVVLTGSAAPARIAQNNRP